MTKEEYERQQSVVRRVYDPDTGRHRLVKGDGEIIEEIVSRERQKAINKVSSLSYSNQHPQCQCAQDNLSMEDILYSSSIVLYIL